MPPPKGIVQQIDQELHRRPLLKPKMRLLVACSGGADSVALLRLMHAMNGSAHWGWHLVAGHIDHGLRGKQSDGDAEFVKKLGKSLGIQVVIRKIRMAGSSEAEARDKRFSALRDILKKEKLDAVVMAHHQDDQAETVLLRLARGCGVRGAAGIARKSRMNDVLILRPLLNVTGSALRDYLNQINQPWREDASNQSLRYRRNIVRHQIMPALRQINPDAAATLARFASWCRQADHAVAAAAKKIKVTRQRGTQIISRDALRRKPFAVRGLVLRQALADSGVNPDRIDPDNLHALIRAVTQRASGLMFTFSGGIAVKILREQVVIGQGKLNKRRTERKKNVHKS